MAWPHKLLNLKNNMQEWYDIFLVDAEKNISPRKRTFEFNDETIALVLKHWSEEIF